MASLSSYPPLPTAPLFLEKKVAERLGISRAEIQLIRSTVLEKTTHWAMAGREVALTREGLEAVLQHLRLTTGWPQPMRVDFADCEVQVPPQKKNGATAGTEAAANGLTQLTVKRIYPNPRLLLAIDPAGNEVRVRVNSNLNFVPRMGLLAVHVNNGLYQMQGRCPRFKGRY